MVQSHVLPLFFFSSHFPPPPPAPAPPPPPSYVSKVLVSSEAAVSPWIRRRASLKNTALCTVHTMQCCGWDYTLSLVTSSLCFSRRLSSIFDYLL